MDQIEDVSVDLQNVKGENSIVLKLKEGFKDTKLILTNQVYLCFTDSCSSVMVKTNYLLQIFIIEFSIPQKNRRNLTYVKLLQN